MDKRVKNIIEWIVCIIIAIVLALIVRYFIGTQTVVRQSSMYPTLQEGQRLWLNRWGRTTKTLPNRGDIITFEAPSVVYPKEYQVDLENPVAIYEEKEGLINKFSYYVLELNKKSYIKRVIALPGEYVEIKDGKVYIDGEELEEDYLQDGVVTDLGRGSYTGFTVPENCVFAMGDNRNDSIDCRVFGCIPLEKIEGKVSFRIWPFDLFGKVE
jgi:signal peptidase I